MPAAITHFLHAEDVAAAMGLTVDSAFRLGCQGPDFLFCHRFFPWQKGPSAAAFGSLLHEADPRVLFTQLQALAGDDPQLGAYARGFLCHYALDRTCHPYIRALAAALLNEEPAQNESVLHNEVESALDTIVLRWKTGRLPGSFSVRATVDADPPLRRAVAGLYAELARAFGQPLAPPVFEQALRDARFAFSALRDRTGLKLRLVRRLEGGGLRKISCHLRPMLENADVDYANVGETPLRDPLTGAVVEESFFSLFEKAVADAQALVAAWQAKTPLAPLCDRDFEGNKFQK